MAGIQCITYGSRWQGMETRISYPRRHPLTLPADRTIEYPIVAGLVCVSYQFLSGIPFHPAAAYARVVGRLVEHAGSEQTWNFHL